MKRPVQHALGRPVRTGADRLFSDRADLVRGKRVGLMTNHTGILSDGRHLTDALAEGTVGRLAALFGPEHGFAGTAPAGIKVGSVTHPKYGVPVFSLYGETKKPTRDMLQGIDVMICDIQDVGARFYTYISTIATIMEAAAENAVPVIILDRPNPIQGLHFSGPIREPAFKSFVGWMPIPIAHGMTIGELARMTNDEGWMANGVKAQLEVVTMDGWRRDMWFDETGLQWIPPSPNMPTVNTAVVYPGLCLFEGTNISEGRGTASPFLLIGAPWAEPGKIIRHLNEFQIPGAAFGGLDYTPHEIPNVAAKPKFEGQLCHGVQVVVTDRNRLDAVRLGIAMVAAFLRAHPEATSIHEGRFDRLMGVSSTRQQLLAGATPDDICGKWGAELKQFGELRRRYLMYS